MSTPPTTRLPLTIEAARRDLTDDERTQLDRIVAECAHLGAWSREDRLWRIADQRAREACYRLLGGDTKGAMSAARLASALMLVDTATLGGAA